MAYNALPWSNPIRQRLYHKIALATCGLIPITLICSYMMASVRDPPHARASYITQSMMHYLPMRTFSRLMGMLSASTMIPEWLHHLAIRQLISIYSIDMRDFVEEDIEKYNTLQKFFTRDIKGPARPVHTDACVVSPCDGTVQSIIDIDHHDELGDAFIENVKGDTFRLSNFLQFYPGKIAPGDKRVAVIFHLGPGDYHGFHSPVENLNITRTVHVPGKLFPVKSTAIKWIPGIFVSNERVILSSSKCIMGLVGASMVGSIRLPWEQRIATNVINVSQSSMINNYSQGHTTLKGSKLGSFEFGSCVVLIVDVSNDVQCKVSVGDRVHVGEAVYEENQALVRNNDV